MKCFKTDINHSQGEGWCISKHSDMYDFSVRHFVQLAVALVALPGDT